jgi:ABC-type transporter Mla MlaB component
VNDTAKAFRCSVTSIEIISGPVVEVALQGDINIFVTARLKQELSKALELTNDIRLSLAGASTLDITAIQLLWAAARHARMQGRAFTFETPLPAEILASLHVAGIPCGPLLEGK